MTRPYFRENPRLYVHIPRVYQSPADYATPFHHVAGRTAGYSRAWWAVVLACGFFGLLLTAFT